MKADRYYRIALASLAAVALVLQLAAFGPWRSSLWGFDLLAFLPLPAAVASMALTLAALVALVTTRGSRTIDGILAALDDARLTRFGLPVLAATSALVFWFLRSGQTLLGDAWQLVSDLPNGLRFHPRQPLTMYLQQLLYRGAGGLFATRAADAPSVAMHTVALGSVVAGVLFVLVAWALGRTLARAAAEDATSLVVPARPRRGSVPERAQIAASSLAAGTHATAILVTLVLLSQGYALLFYGYLENYSLYAACVALYLLAALHCLRGRLPLYVPTVILVFTLGLHLSAGALLPTWVFLAARRLSGLTTRKSAWRDLGLGALAVLVLDRVVAAMSPGFSLWKAVSGIFATAMSDQGGGSGLLYIFSGVHLRDFLDEQYLIGPLGAFFFVPAVFFSSARLRRDPGAAFLALTGAVVLLACWITAEPALGYARDWDLFSPVGVVFTLAGLYFLVVQVHPSVARNRLLAFALLVSFLHLGAWVWVDHSQARSVARFATLPLGHGRTELVLGNWHLRNGRTDEAIRWFDKALQADPRNGTAHEFLGYIYAQRGDMQHAVDAYAKACQARPDKALFRHNLIRALEAQRRYAETLPHFDMLCAAEPDSAGNWLGHAGILRALGRDPEARAVLERALPHFTQAVQRRPDDFQGNNDLGVLLLNLGRREEALPLFQRALRQAPNSDTALYNLGGALYQLGRTQEARPYLERLLQLYPDHAMKGEVRDWLARTGSK